ncbi:hypothetical protein C8R44DRAFT_623679, partial [Mycena epipterygia]
DVPLLHKDGSQEYDIHTCFLSPVLMRLYASLIRGPGGAAKLLKADSGESFSKSDVMEYIHGIDHTEPGAIAAASVLVRWTELHGEIAYGSARLSGASPPTGACTHAGTPRISTTRLVLMSTSTS